MTPSHITALTVRRRGGTFFRRSFNSLGNWSATWQLPFNIRKCWCLHLGSNNTKAQYFLQDSSGSNAPVLTCTQEKDLGILTDDTLTFTAHIHNKAQSILHVIRHLFTFMDKQIFLHPHKPGSQHTVAETLANWPELNIFHVVVEWHCQLITALA